MNQLDVRVAKAVKVGHGRVQGTVSVFNVLNANTPLYLNPNYGPSWLTPALTLQGRLVKFGAWGTFLRAAVRWSVPDFLPADFFLRVVFFLVAMRRSLSGGSGGVAENSRRISWSRISGAY